MDGSVKLFQLVQKFYQTIGIHPSRRLNWRILIISFTIIAEFFGVLGFFIFRATSITEYGTIFFAITSSLYAFAELHLNLWRIPEILQLIELCEIFIANSKYQQSIVTQCRACLTCETSIRIEKWFNANYKIPPIKWKNWTNVSRSTVRNGQINNCRSNIATSDYNTTQLLRLWFGRGILSKYWCDVWIDRTIV